MREVLKKVVRITCCPCCTKSPWIYARVTVKAYDHEAVVAIVRPQIITKQVP